MTHEKRPETPEHLKRFVQDGKPLKVLTTSLGIALLANALSPAAYGASAPATSTAEGNAASAPRLVEWSTEEVKAYFDPSVDWNLPDLAEDANANGSAAQGGGGGNGASGGTTVIHTSSGFGWDDLILYHLLFNNGAAYSSTSWTSSHPTYYAGTRTRYRPTAYSSETFQNKPVAGSSVRPKTKDTTGTITRRSTSSKQGGIGGTSSRMSSGSSSKSSSHGFGG